MRGLLGLSCGFVALVSLILPLHAAAQETQAKLACIAADEHVYRPGVDGVKAPEPQPDKNTKNAPEMRGPFSIELVVNPEGRVCTAKVLTARDRLAAQRAADYMTERWLFKPATRKGKPVAVRFTVNFNPR